MSLCNIFLSIRQFFSRRHCEERKLRSNPGASEKLGYRGPSGLAMTIPLYLCCFLTGCGFQPLYVPIRGSSHIAVPVKISTIRDRNGQILRNYLVDLLTPEGPERFCKKPLYILDITLTESIIDIGIRRDETASRKNAIMTASLTLKDSKTNAIVYTHRTKSVNSFAIISQNYFSDLTTEDYAKKEALRLLAEKISLLVITYLDSKNES